MTPNANKDSSQTTTMSSIPKNKPNRGRPRYRRGSRNTSPVTPTQNQTPTQTPFPDSSLPTPPLTRSQARRTGTAKHATGSKKKSRHVQWENSPTKKLGEKAKGVGSSINVSNIVGGEIGRIRRQYDMFLLGEGEGTGSGEVKEVKEKGGDEIKGKAGAEGFKNGRRDMVGGIHSPAQSIPPIPRYQNLTLETLDMQTRETPEKTPFQKKITFEPKKNLPIENAVVEVQRDISVKSGDEHRNEEGEVEKGLEEIQRIMSKLEAQVCRIKENRLELERLRMREDK